jgi:DNA helicase II / ATP-dependent DNA helicase PcrA
VVVSTMHKAKGLEWDRVYLMAVNTYNFPSADVGDQYIAERWFLRDSLNLEAEALSQLKALFDADEYQYYTQGAASQAARLDYVRERLRLFYVCVTRAKEELVVTWNTGRRGNLGPSKPFMELMKYWNERYQRVLE